MRFRALDLAECQTHEAEQCGPVQAPLAQSVLGYLGRLAKWERASKEGKGLMPKAAASRPVQFLIKVLLRC
jgi:hypothetical protein